LGYQVFIEDLNILKCSLVWFDNACVRSTRARFTTYQTCHTNS